MRYGLRTLLLALAFAPVGIWLVSLALPTLVVLVDETIANVRWLATR
ncbi:MAG: hypothetical protein SFU86_17985 [Pirellulaceae bacterium]|nr:hypothetical protein [Pirellulaceae bacterium]